MKGWTLKIIAAVVAALPMAAGAATITPPRSSSEVVASPARAAADELTRALENTYQLIQSREAAANDASASAPTADTGTSQKPPAIDMPDNAAVERAMRHLTNDIPDKIQSSLDRSATYLPMIERIFERYDLPRQLAYLPVIESAFNTHITSRAGAKGLWQFTAETARAYGLRVDWWVDERADPQKSTRAAAEYLKELWNSFGDWSLVLASYNAGPGRVRRTLDRHGTTDYWSLHDIGALPRETRGYVPTFWATMKIVSNPKKFGFKLAPPAGNDTTTIDVEGPVSLSWIASTIGIDRGGLRALNPAILHGMTPPGSYPIHVPTAVAHALAAGAESMHFDDPAVAASKYTVRRGDSIWRLARRLGVRTSTIRSMNGKRRNHLAVGETIWLPVSETSLSSRLHETKGTIHVVRRGDTLSEIAFRYGLSVDDLLDLNGLTKKSVIHPGDRIRVAPATGVAAGGM